MVYTVQFRGRANFRGPVRKSSSTIEVALVFFECVRDEGATNQRMVGDKVARITNCISPDNLSIRAEKVIRPRPDDVPLAFLMPSILPFKFTAQLEMVMHIQQSGISQNIGNLQIPCGFNRIKVEIEISY